MTPGPTITDSFCGRRSGCDCAGLRAQASVITMICVLRAMIGKDPAAPGTHGKPIRRRSDEATLWEVKIGPDGAVVETEISDEDL